MPSLLLVVRNCGLTFYITAFFSVKEPCDSDDGHDVSLSAPCQLMDKVWSIMITCGNHEIVTLLSLDSLSSNFTRPVTRFDFRRFGNILNNRNVGGFIKKGHAFCPKSG